MNYKIAQFILTPPQRGQSALEIYVAQPDANKEALAGKLFAMFEIESTKATGLKIISFLINSLNYNYYQNEKIILRERVSAIKIEHIFESALAKTNKKLAEFLQTEKIKLNPDIFNLTIGVIYNDSLHFANLGKNKALLIYKSRPGDNVKHKLADITEQTSAPETKKSPNGIKLFSNIISGSLPRGGYFILASETFAEYLSAKQIISIVTALPPASAAEQIKNTLSQINAFVPFLGIIIKNAAGLEKSEIKIKEEAASTKSSINNLIVTEEKTEKLLTPSGLINAKKWSLFFDDLIGRLTFNRTAKISRPGLWLKDKIFIKRKTDWPSLKKIFNNFKNLVIYLIGWLIYLFKIIANQEALVEFFRNLISKIKNFLMSSRASGLKLFFWYKNLNKINKILFSAFIICLVIFSASLGAQGLKNKTKKKQALITSLTSAIEQKQNQIDASLLYNNEIGIRKLLLEVKDLLRQLPQNNQNQKARYLALAAKYQAQIEKIGRVIRATPLELANFSNLNPSARPTNIILVKGKLYAADAAHSAIYGFDLKNKLVTSIKLNNNLGRLDYPNLDKNDNIYYFGSSRVAVLNTKSEKLSELNISYKGGLEKIAAFKLYNNRFYLVDAAAGQIYRFTKNADQLINPLAWLNSQTDLTNIVGLDIDGNVYLLKDNGEILKYNKGVKQDFNPAPIEPALSRSAKITVSPEQDYIYIFDPLNKRLVVLNKAGQFKNQYLSDQLNNLKDCEIDEINKKIYFLNDTTVYSIDLVDTK